VCQHVHCIKNKKGEITEGSEAEIKNVFYVWKVRREMENTEDFDWYARLLLSPALPVPLVLPASYLAIAWLCLFLLASLASPRLAAAHLLHSLRVVTELYLQRVYSLV
jgi:hypothetical protein